MNIFDDITKDIDYQTFLKIIYNIPSCIFFKDTNLRYVFCTKHWEQQKDINIIGKTDLEIRKDEENVAQAIETDKEIIKTGKGCSYVVKTDVEGGSLGYFEIIKEPVFDEENKVIGIVGLINNITEKKLYEQKLKELNTTDHLTGLYNRKTGVEIMDAMLNDHLENLAFLLLDLNKFKFINDELGHQTGDEVLQKFAKALKASLYDSDIAMRLGGDEFIILLQNIHNKEQIKDFIHKLWENIDKIEINKLNESITMSIGAIMVKEKKPFDHFYAIADELMYKAKNNGIPYIIR